MKYQKIIIPFFVFFALISLLFLLITFTATNKVTTGFNITVMPNDSQILIDGKGANPGTNSTKPGVHEITVKRDGFTQTTGKYTSKKDEVVSVDVGLTASDSIGGKWVKDHQQEITSFVAIGDSEFMAQNTKMANKYPLFSQLPVDMSPLYKLYYGVSKKYPNDSSKLAVYIDFDNPTDRFAAVKNIYTLGYDPSDYEIIFKELPD